MGHEIDTREALLAHIAAHGHLCDQVVQELDLRTDTQLLRTTPSDRAAFLGCQLEPEAVIALYRSGADLFPPLSEELPFRPYRNGLYSVEELYEGFDPSEPGSFSQARDSLIYTYYSGLREGGEPLPIMEALALRLHDHAIEDALGEVLVDGSGALRKVVAIMGGHAMRRDEASFQEVAELARALTRRGYFVATGGGPGAMEAGNLGAYLAHAPDAALQDAIATLRAEPRYSEHRYLELGAAVRRRYVAESGASLAVPTWFYGHEPSNQFASHIAKYFANSVREDGLLAIATHGVVFAPGSAGTVQEVFQDACQNHYGTCPLVSPMVLLGRTHWTEQLPVWPLLQALSHDEPWADLLGLCEGGSEALAFIETHPPVPSKAPAGSC